MLARYLLAALADGVAAADEEIARRSIGRIDWVLRGYALRRLNTLLMDAALETGVIHLDDAGERRHILEPRVGTDLPQHLGAAHARQAHVKQHHVGPLAVQRGQRIATIRGC